MSTDTTVEQLVSTNGRCLTALCGEPARYALLIADGWWWPKCVDCTAYMRALDHPNLPIAAVQDYDTVAARLGSVTEQ